VEVLKDLQMERNTATRTSLPLSVVSEIRSVVLEFIEYHMDRKIKSASFLQDLAIV
jgi:hypothetical protein